MIKDTVEIVIQINGKVKEKLEVASNLSKEEFQKIAMENVKVKALIDKKNVIRVIAVPDRLLNIVIS